MISRSPGVHARPPQLPGPAWSYFDIDQLAMCYPIRGDDPHRDRLKAHALGEVLAFGARAKRYVIGQIRKEALQARRDTNDCAAR